MLIIIIYSKDNNYSYDDNKMIFLFPIIVEIKYAKFWPWEKKYVKNQPKTIVLIGSLVFCLISYKSLKDKRNTDLKCKDLSPVESICVVSL